MQPQQQGVSLEQVVHMHQYFKGVPNPSPKIKEIIDKLEEILHSSILSMAPKPK